MSGHDIVVLVVSIIGGGGLIAGIVALLKLRPEAGQILVTTAQGVVIVQTTVIDNLQKELTRMGKELDELREECRVREEMLLNRIRELEKASG
jgi:threonine dehydratase